MVFVVIAFIVRPMITAPGVLKDYYVWIVVGILVLELVESIVMLSKFKKAEQKRAQAIVGD